MDQGIIEIYVRRRNNPAMSFGKIALIAAAVLLLLAGIFLLLVSDGLVLALILIVLGIAAIVGAWFCSNNLNLEFECALVDRELRIAKVIGGEKRKDLGTYDLDQLEILAPVKSHRLDSLRSRKLLHDIDCTSHDPSREDSNYRCYLEGSTCITLDLSGERGEKLLNAVRMFAPRKVYTD